MNTPSRALDTPRSAVRTGTLFTALAGTLLALAAPPAAQAQSTLGYYVGLHAGANDLNRWPATVNFGAGVRTQGGLSLDSGAQVGLAVGRRTENARFEVEYQRGRFQLRGTDLGAVSESASGGGHYQTLMINADRVLPLNGAMAAYVGGGLGWGSVSFPGAGGAACRCFGETTGNGLAYQGRVGLEYSFARGPNLFVQAAWISLPGGSSSGTPGVEYPRRGTATLDAGLRLRF